MCFTILNSFQVKLRYLWHMTAVADNGMNISLLLKNLSLMYYFVLPFYCIIYYCSICIYYLMHALFYPVHDSGSDKTEENKIY